MEIRAVSNGFLGSRSRERTVPLFLEADARLESKNNRPRGDAPRDSAFYSDCSLIECTNPAHLFLFDRDEMRLHRLYDTSVFGGLTVVLLVISDRGVKYLWVRRQ